MIFCLAYKNFKLKEGEKSKSIKLHSIEQITQAKKLLSPRMIRYILEEENCIIEDIDSGKPFVFYMDGCGIISFDC